MTKRFECKVCEEEFSSAYEMVQHFRTAEHLKKGGIGNLNSLIEKFVGGIKADFRKDDDKKL